MMFQKKDLLLITNEESLPEKDMHFVEATEWEQTGKYQFRDVIFRHGGKFYLIEESRSGSPFSEWNYNSEYWPDEVECEEVKKVEIVTYEWEPV